MEKEIWKLVNGTKSLYVSSNGRVMKNNKELFGSLDMRSNRYIINTKYDNMPGNPRLTMSIAQLIKLTFDGPSNDPTAFVIFKNGNSRDCRISNLMWNSEIDDNLPYLFSKYPDEVWKRIDGYGGYYVSNYGQVFSTKRNSLCTPVKDKDGYLRVGLTSNDNEIKTLKIHRIVAYAFIPNDDVENKTQINHKDENKENNHVSNLEWCDALYNNYYGTRNERAFKNMRISIQNKILENSSEINHLLLSENNDKFNTMFEVTSDSEEFLTPKYFMLPKL